MKRLLLLISLAISQTTFASEQLPLFSTDYSPERNPFVDARSAISLASEGNKRILIEVGGDWCIWCHELDRVIKSDSDISTMLYGNFVILKVNVSEENYNADFMATMPKVAGYPQLFVARSNGSIIHIQDPSDFLVEGKYSANRVYNFLYKWKDS